MRVLGTVALSCHVAQTDSRSSHPRRLLCPIHGAAGTSFKPPQVKNILTAKLKLLQAAAPRATLHLLNDGGRFALYLSQVEAARRLTLLGTITDYAEDVLEDSVPVLTVDLEDMPKFLDEITVGHTVALIDVCLPTREMAARHVAFAYIPKKAAPVEKSDDFWG